VAETQSWLDRNWFFLRRLHSLAGIVPVGAFLINHLLTNSTAALGAKYVDGRLVGGAQFDEHVHWIHSIPYLLFVEIGLIFLPLLYHAIFGVIIAFQAKHNVTRYGWADNWRYSLQRWTGWIALVFILLHLSHFRFAHWFGGQLYVGTETPFDSLRTGFPAWGLPMAAWMAIYIVGLVASVYHFCNGIVTFCITWGITVNDTSRQRVSLGAAGLGLLLLAWGGLSLWAVTSIEAKNPIRAATPAAMGHGDPATIAGVTGARVGG
jgi:succinate dehydrogenase / fumarate reductase cytochrome b subunit